jgi:hypothetical protein
VYPRRVERQTSHGGASPHDRIARHWSAAGPPNPGAVGDPAQPCSRLKRLRVAVRLGSALPRRTTRGPLHLHTARVRSTRPSRPIADIEKTLVCEPGWRVPCRPRPGWWRCRRVCNSSRSDRSMPPSSGDARANADWGATGRPEPPSLVGWACENRPGYAVGADERLRMEFVSDSLKCRCLRRGRPVSSSHRCSRRLRWMSMA